MEDEKKETNQNNRNAAEEEKEGEGREKKQEKQNEGKDDELAKGIAMIYTNFIEALKKEGIEEIDAKGRFDPYKHEIVMTKESEKEDGTILEVVKKGYALGGLLIRPASVIVSKKVQEGKKQN